jgi:transglutaminase-like putative cysteine protease
MKFATFAVSLLAAAAPVHAGNDQVQRAAVPDWVVPSELMPVPEAPAGLVFVRRSDGLVHFDAQGQEYYQSYRMRILHPNALQLGNLSIAWDPSAGAPTVHFIRVYRGEQVIDVLETASFEILRREGQLEAASLDGTLTAILRVPDLRVGDELEVGLTTRSNDPTLGANDAGLLVLAADPAPGRYRLGLSWEEGNEPRLRMTPEMAAAAQRQARAVTFSFDNPGPLTPPNDAPPRYGWQRVIEYSDFPDWASISRHFARLFTQAATLDAGSPLREEARRIAAAHSTPLDRAGAALRLVQQDVRYVYVGLNGGNLTPATADATWQRRYGDCKAKTALLLALLGELGIEAEPVLASNAGADDGLDERLPNPRIFDHVLVRARINGSDYWLDGTLPPVAGPARAPVMPYRWTLPLTAQGRSIEHREWRPSDRPDEVTLHEIDARAGFDQPARITNTTIIRGIAGLQAHAQFSGLTPAQLLSAMRQQLVGSTWQTIDDVQWRYDARAQASILTISGTGTIDWSDEGGGAKSLTLPGGGFNPPERRVRPAEQNQDLPYYNESNFNCHVTTVRLPQSTQASHWSFNSGFDTHLFGRNYYRAFDLRDGAIRMVRGSRVEQREIDAATARRDNQRIAAFDNTMALISYEPSGGGSHGGTDGRVPATYEIDWTADSVPCLSSSAAGRLASQ